MITTYTTHSGSIYLVRVLDGITEIKRNWLGRKHFERGPEHRAKRTADNLASWRKCRLVSCAGIGDILRIYFEEEGDELFTNRVKSIEIELS
jgi:hypothetical protein